MPAGRPTKLTEELLEKAKTYLGTCYVTPIYAKSGALSYADVKLPKIASFALFLGINRDTVYEWCKGDSELAQQFADIVKEINTSQEEMLIDKGLGGIFQPKTTGMMLSKHGYSEKIETDLTSKGESIKMNPQTIALAQEYENKLKENL
jgi:hypothetical protein